MKVSRRCRQLMQMLAVASYLYPPVRDTGLLRADTRTPLDARAPNHSTAIARGCCCGPMAQGHRRAGANLIDLIEGKTILEGGSLYTKSRDTSPLLTKVQRSTATAQTG